MGLMSCDARIIEGYVHNGRIGVLVEFSLQTSFTAGTPDFKRLAKDIALQVAAAPAASVEALLAEPFVKDNSLTVGALLGKASTELGERILITRFVRWDTEHPTGEPSSPPPAAAMRLRRAS